MNTGVFGVVPGVGFGVGTNFGNQAFDIKVLGIVSQDTVEIFKIIFVVLRIFGIFVPGNEVKAETIVGGGLEKGFNPVAVVGSNGWTADLINSISGSIDDGPGGLGVKGGVGGRFGIVPAAKKIGFVPNFVVDARNSFFS